MSARDGGEMVLTLHGGRTQPCISFMQKQYKGILNKKYLNSKKCLLKKVEPEPAIEAQGVKGFPLAPDANGFASVDRRHDAE